MKEKNKARSTIDYLLAKEEYQANKTKSRFINFFIFITGFDIFKHSLQKMGNGKGLIKIKEDIRNGFSYEKDDYADSNNFEEFYERHQCTEDHLRKRYKQLALISYISLAAFLGFFFLLSYSYGSKNYLGCLNASFAIVISIMNYMKYIMLAYKIKRRDFFVGRPKELLKAFCSLDDLFPTSLPESSFKAVNKETGKEVKVQLLKK
ncbi:hypothetical protein [Pantoea agglomerans]|uniref:hypothetical protein n=1 Tax=Enterobacter agglomerans TaxID=549 RepID=UPI0034CD8ED9